jgi:hypothetical protein
VTNIALSSLGVPPAFVYQIDSHSLFWRFNTKRSLLCQAGMSLLQETMLARTVRAVLACTLRENAMRNIVPSSDDGLPLRKHFRHWLERCFLSFYQGARSPESPPPVLPPAARPLEIRTARPEPQRSTSQLAQFPGLEFRADEIGLDDRATDNDAAIRASLIYFKHRWPGRVAEIDGPEAFRLKAWRIAQEVRVPIKAARRNVARQDKPARRGLPENSRPFQSEAEGS